MGRMTGQGTSGCDVVRERDLIFKADAEWTHFLHGRKHNWCHIWASVLVAMRVAEERLLLWGALLEAFCRPHGDGALNIEKAYIFMRCPIVPSDEWLDA